MLVPIIEGSSLKQHLDVRAGQLWVVRKARMLGKLIDVRHTARKVRQSLKALSLLNAALRRAALVFAWA